MVYDINLLPKAKKNEGGRYGLLMFLIGLLCAVILIVFFFLLPLRIRIEMSKQIAEYNEQLASYSGSDAEYLIVADQLQQLQSITTDITALRENKSNVSGVLEDIGTAMPKDVVLTAVTADNGLLTLTGTTASYTNISRFIVKLREIDKVEQVTFTSAIKRNETENLASGSEVYEFTVFIQYEVIETTEQLEEAAVEVQEGE